MRTSKRNNNKMESKTQTQHNRKKATRIRVSERDQERAERKVKRARPTKLAKEASSTAVMADETSLPATTTTATIFSNSFHCKRQSREEPAAEEQERKTGQGEGGAQHKVVATCCRMFLLTAYSLFGRSAAPPSLSLYLSHTLWWVRVARLWQTVLKRESAGVGGWRESVGSFAAQLFDEFLIGSCCLFIRGERVFWNYANCKMTKLEYILLD